MTGIRKCILGFWHWCTGSLEVFMSLYNRLNCVKPDSIFCCLDIDFMVRHSFINFYHWKKYYSISLVMK